MAAEDPSQLRKQWCWGGCCFLCSTTAQTEQHLLQMPINSSFLVCAPNITATPLFALYECLCVRFNQPASATTLIAGTPWLSGSHERQWHAAPLPLQFVPSSQGASLFISLGKKVSVKLDFK